MDVSKECEVYVLAFLAMCVCVHVCMCAHVRILSEGLADVISTHEHQNVLHSEIHVSQLDPS